MDLGSLIFIPVGVVIIVSIFLVADYKVKKRNREEYERTGIRPEYKNTDAMEYVMEASNDIMEKTYKVRYIMSGVSTMFGGILGLVMCHNWGMILTGDGIGITDIIFFVPLAGIVIYGTIRVIKGIRMK